MKEWLQRQIHPEVRKTLVHAQRLTGKEPVIKEVPLLPGDVKAQLVRPHIPGRPYEIQVARGQERVIEHLITHEVGHIARLHQVPEEERLAPAIPLATRRVAAEQLLPDLTPSWSLACPKTTPSTSSARGTGIWSCSWPTSRLTCASSNGCMTG
jgi:hypothetical protein